MANFAFNFKTQSSPAYICYSIIFVCLLTTSHGKLTVTPTDVNVTEGESVRLKCSTDSGKPVNWQFGKQVDRMRDVYINGDGLVSHYRSLKRYRVEENNTTGQYDLLISNTTYDDAGFYICSELTGKDDPPHARLLISGMESLTKFCRKNFVISVVDAKTELTFSECKKPFYIAHLPFGEKYFRAVYDKERLFNGYADGRFNVQQLSNGGCLFSIQNTSILDAGTFTCTDHSGSGEKHAVELVTLVRLPECSANYSNSSLTADPPDTRVEARCEANFIGKCVPLFSWWHQNGSTGGYMTDPAKTTTHQQGDDMVYSTAVVHSNSKVICYVWEPRMRENSSFQCTFLPENGGNESSSSEQEEVNLTCVLAAVLTALAAILIIIPVTVVLWARRRRHRRRHTRHTLTTSAPNAPCETVPFKDGGRIDWSSSSNERDFCDSVVVILEPLDVTKNDDQLDNTRTESPVVRQQMANKDTSSTTAAAADAKYIASGH